jgi:hypothetical protein
MKQSPSSGVRDAFELRPGQQTFVPPRQQKMLTHAEHEHPAMAMLS